jgi:hypothetical protein
MGISCRIVVAALTLAVFAAPVAAAHGPQTDGGAVVSPARGGGLTGGQLLGEAWARANYSNDPNPLNGTCESIARDVLAAHFDDDLTATCTATQRTRLFLYFGTACFNVEEGVGETRGEQLACAVASDRAVDELNVTVDDGEIINIVNQRFELFSPQRMVQLPEDNVFGVAAQTVTFTAHAWGAVVRRLRPGQHIVTFQLVAPDFGGSFTFTINLNVVRSGRSGEDDHD